MQLPQLMIFDMDGLIFDTERLFMQEKNKILPLYGYPAEEEDYLQTVGLAGESLRAKLAELYGPDYPAEEISAKTRERVNAYMQRHGPDVKPGIRTLLSWLREQGVPCCVASSTRSREVSLYLRLAGLDRYFSHLIGGEEVPRSKPAPDIFLAACAHFLVEPACAVVLEDSENGILSASAAGIPVICIPDLKQPSPRIAERAAAVLRRADEVIGLLTRSPGSD